jgi:hypothetical protein
MRPDRHGTWLTIHWRPQGGAFDLANLVLHLPAIVHFGQRPQFQQVSGPGVEGQSAAFNPASLPLTNCPS